MELTLVAIWLVTGFAIAAVAGAALIPLLKRFQFKQHAYEDAPQTHQKKTGTPTMGGVVFVLALLPLLAPLTAYFSEPKGTWGVTFEAPSALSLALLALVLLCALVGFVDDLLGVTRGRNQGLRARTKLLATALIAIVFLRWIDGSFGFYPRDVIFHTGAFVLTAPHWLWLLLGIIAVVGTIHAVNLTDGLDGLATGTMLPPLALLAVLGYAMQVGAPTQAAVLGIGACLGFLIYNRHPAKMFMGDTGSLALGALLSGVAILEGEMLLLVLIGGVFVAEALSVILQVTYFKLSGGKRIFRMSPLHHHFEIGGWPETKVTYRFWAASAVLSLLGWAIVR